MTSKKKKNKRLWSYYLLRVLVVGLPLLLVIVLCIPVATTFSVSATTEFIEYQITDSNSSSIPLRQVQAVNYETDSVWKFDGTFKANLGATVTVQRIAYGPLVLHIKGLNVGSAGDYISAETDYKEGEAPNFIEFVIDSIPARVDAGETVIIPLSGKVTSGRTVNYQTYDHSTAILREGTVSIISKSILGNTYFKSATYDLETGEQFVIEKPISKAFGFIVINEDAGMHAVYKIIGKKGKIITSGPVNEHSGYAIKTSLMSRFENDLFIKGLSSIIAIIIAFVTIQPFFVKRDRKT